MIYQNIDLTADQKTASLTTYLLESLTETDPDRTRPLVIICPGGGYRFVSEREAEPVALQFNAMGIHACILRYSVYPEKFPTALIQLAKSVAYVREHAKEWHVRPDRIIISGFSAGGHLAASLGTLWHEKFLEDIMQVSKAEYQPNGMILCYPVITSGAFKDHESFEALLQDRFDELKDKLSLEKQVSKFTPPAFLWSTFEDDNVMVENTMLFATAMKEKNIPFELHIYQRGMHGLSLANEETWVKSCNFGLQPECQNWIAMAGTWVKNL